MDQTRHCVCFHQILFFEDLLSLFVRFVNLRDEIVCCLFEDKVLALDIRDPRVNLRDVDPACYWLLLSRRKACEGLLSRLCRFLDVFTIQYHVYFPLSLGKPLRCFRLLDSVLDFGFRSTEVKVTLISVIRLNLSRLCHEFDCRVLLLSGWCRLDISCELTFFLDHELELVCEFTVL